MPRQRNRAPYTQLLSALRKNDLLRLCTEFHLPVNGAVVTLRNRLKDYLNLHRDTLYRDPRYNALFPRHPRLKPNPRKNSPATLSYASLSPERSFASWNGIDDAPGSPQHTPPPPHLHDYNQPPSTPSISELGRSPSPVAPIIDERKPFFLSHSFSRRFPFRRFHVYTTFGFTISGHYAVLHRTALCSLRLYDTMKSFLHPGHYGVLLNRDVALCSPPYYDCSLQTIRLSHSYPKTDVSLSYIVFPFYLL
jgi:hypothetical protein